MATQMSRRCIPYTPFENRLDKAIVALISSAGVHMKSQEPFDLKDERGDCSFRIIPGDASASDLMITNPHYDHSDADRDINTVFPIEILRALVAAGQLGGVAEKMIGLIGRSTQLKRIQDDTAVKIATEIERSSANAALLMAGCAISHRTICVIQREIELRGISTVLITLKPEESRPLRPPRGLYPIGFHLGHCLGNANAPALQNKVLLDALSLLCENILPGTIVEHKYGEYAE